MLNTGKKKYWNHWYRDQWRHARSNETFGETLNISQLDQQYMSKPAQVKDDAESKQRFNEMLCWFKYEIRQYTESNISLEDLNQHKDIITLLNGIDSKGSFP